LNDLQELARATVKCYFGDTVDEAHSEWISANGESVNVYNKDAIIKSWRNICETASLFELGEVD
jgi:hypothetical protein